MPMPKAPVVAKNCEFCGAAMTRRMQPGGKLESQWRFLRRHYCSRACSDLSKVQENPASRAACNRRARAACIGDSCQQCPTEKNLHVHHKNEDWHDNRPENLVRLCAQCHTRHHSIKRADAWRSAQAKHCAYCDKPIKVRGLCSGHCHRLYRYGDPLEPLRKIVRYGPDDKCIKCDQRARSAWMCKRHYMAERNNKAEPSKSVDLANLRQ